jgi:hypothetical protein
VFAGILGALATATRPNGIAVVAACAWAAFVAVRQRREWRSLAAVTLSPAGIVGWFAYLKVSTGSGLAYVHTQQGAWGEKLEPAAFIHLVSSDLHHILRFPNQYVVIISTVAGVLLLVHLVHTRAPGTWVAYSVVIMGLALLSSRVGMRPRFVLAAVPVVVALGARLRGDARSAVLACSGALMAGLLVLSTSGITLTP